MSDLFKIKVPHEVPNNITMFSDMTPRDYQHEAFNQIIETDGDCVVTNGVRSGKSIIIYLAAKYYEKEEYTVVIVVTNKKLLDQARKMGDVNIVASNNHVSSKDSNIFLCMQQTLVNQLSTIPTDRKIIYIQDEMLSMSTRYQKIIDRLNPEKKIFFSATPYDENGVELESNLKYIKTINNIDMEEKKIWCPVEYYVPTWTTEYDFDDIAMNGADYSQDDIDVKIMKSGWWRNNFKLWFESIDWNNDRILIYTSTISQAESIVELVEHRITVEVAHSKKTDKENKAIIDRYESGATHALVSISSLSIGFDSPKSNVLIDLRITKVRRYAMQLIGRNRNYVEGKIARTYDLANFILWHGFPENEDNFVPQIDKEEGKKQCAIHGEKLLPYVLQQNITLITPEIITNSATEINIKMEVFKNDNTKIAFDDLLSLYDVSTDVNHTIELGAEIYSRIRANVTKQTIKKIKQQISTIRSSIIKKDLYDNLIKKRLKTIIKDNKKFYALFYYPEWLTKDSYIDFGKATYDIEIDF